MLTWFHHTHTKQLEQCIKKNSFYGIGKLLMTIRQQLWITSLKLWIYSHVLPYGRTIGLKIHLKARLKKFTSLYSQKKKLQTLAYTNSTEDHYKYRTWVPELCLIHHEVRSTSIHHTTIVYTRPKNSGQPQSNTNTQKIKYSNISLVIVNTMSLLELLWVSAPARAHTQKNKKSWLRHFVEHLENEKVKKKNWNIQRIWGKFRPASLTHHTTRTRTTIGLIKLHCSQVSKILETTFLSNQKELKRNRGRTRSQI